MNKGYCENCGKLGRLYLYLNGCIRDGLGDPVQCENVLCKECFDRAEKASSYPKKELEESDIKNIPF